MPIKDKPNKSQTNFNIFCFDKKENRFIVLKTSPETPPKAMQAINT